MFRQKGKYKEARKSWILLVNIHLFLIVISYVLDYSLSDEKSDFFKWLALSLSVSLLILLGTYNLYPEWYRNKNNSIED